MSAPLSPYHRPGFYDAALAKGRHRDIVGGRWEETGRAQMTILRATGLQSAHHLLDIGAGSLRLGCKVVPYLDPGHYWATDKSRSLMRRGHAVEFADPTRLADDHLIEDEHFDFPGVPDLITHVIAFAVFTHLPIDHLDLALRRVRARFAQLAQFLFTVFVAPAGHPGPFRQNDGVVTHPDRAPYHYPMAEVIQLAEARGFSLAPQADRLPRGQVLFVARRTLDPILTTGQGHD